MFLHFILVHLCVYGAAQFGSSTPDSYLNITDVPAVAVVGETYTLTYSSNDLMTPVGIWLNQGETFLYYLAKRKTAIRDFFVWR